MIAGDPLRPPAAGGHRRDQQRGGIGGEDGVVGHDGFETVEQLLFDVQTLGDGLDYQSGGRQGFEAVRRNQAFDGGLGFRLGRVALFLAALQHAGDEAHRFGRLLAVSVVNQRSQATLSEELSDAASHRARADDGDRLEGRGDLSHGGFPPRQAAPNHPRRLRRLLRPERPVD